ncbi:MAG: holin-associated N-acetylmuramidase [Paracoccus sp. (in: a-proteobacteria)]|uniref:holin-associated N-acetylmuramidase n=1 Tax=Paracoccus sp. TaxID=267 RepID=UPI0039E41059
MKSVRDLSLEIVRREGGFVNDPADPGGATKYGVTIGTMRALGIDLTGDGRVTEADVRALTVDRAATIFEQEYFVRPKIGLLPEAIQASVFDMFVNAGSNAVKILQRLLNDLGPHDLVEDGKPGPMTAKAAHQALRDHPDLADLYGIARRDYYYRVADLRPASRKYATTRSGAKGGWILRAEEFVSPALHLTLAEHHARVAAWMH